MITQIKNLLDNYSKSKTSALTSSDICYKVVCNDIPNEISKLIGSDDRFIVHGSVGVGNWAAVPWIAIFDKLVTTTAQKGYYPVFLFKEDMSGFYLSMGVGVTSIRQEFKKNKKIEEVLLLQTSFLLARIEDIPNGFYSNLDSPIVLRNNPSKNGTLAKDYEDGCVISKFYSSDGLPTDQELKIDIQNLVNIYNEITYNTLSESADGLIEEQTKDFPRFTGAESLKKVKQHLRVERNQRLIKEVKIRKGYNCQCCEMNFEERYGDIGKQFIEAHHKQPIHTLTGDVVNLDADQDFFVLCSNCHRMIHKLDDPSDLETLKQKINSQI